MKNKGKLKILIDKIYNWEGFNNPGNPYEFTAPILKPILDQLIYQTTWGFLIYACFNLFFYI